MRTSRAALLVFISALATALIGTGSAAAAPGDLDPTFSGDGIADFQFDALSGSTLAPTGVHVAPVGIQPGGQVILYGRTQYSGECPALGCGGGNIVLARLGNDGSLDDLGGRMPEDGPIGDGRFDFTNPVVDPEGRIVFGGAYGNTAAVLRLTADGFLDPSFGDGGVAMVEVLNGSTPPITSIGLQSDGRIVVGVNSEAPRDSHISQLDVFRLDETGVLDTTFGEGGIAHYEPGGSFASFWGIDVDGSDRIVAMYATADWPGTENPRIVISRLTADGERDQSFGIGGGVGIPVPTTLLPAGALVDSQSRIYLRWPVEFPTGMKRLTADGFPDPTYGPGGVHAFEGRGPGPIVGAALQPDDALIAAATEGSQVVVGRRVADGSADESFAPGGWTRTPAIGHDSPQPAAAPDGRIVVLATGTRNCFSVMRFVGDSGGGGTPSSNPPFECRLWCADRSCIGRERALTIHAGGPRRARGKLRVFNLGCVSAVRVFTTRGSRDRKVGADRELVESQAGTWRYDAKLRNRARGRKVYAKLAPATDPANGLACGDAVSRTIRLPKRVRR